jgi:hypothetical protein
VTRTAEIVARIDGAESGWVFTPSDFFDLGSPQLVGMVLLRLMREGRVRRLRRGLYDVPREHLDLGTLLPTASAIAKAVARRDGLTLRESEAQAANLLHLTEQVPAQVEYQTDGPSREVVVGKQRIRMKGRSPRKVTAVSDSSAMVFSGLRALGARGVDPERVLQLRKLLDLQQRHALLADLRHAPRWMHPFIRLIALEEASPRGDEAS